MTLLYYDPCFLDHDTGSHPENAGRLQHVVEHLAAAGLDRRCSRPSWEAASLEQLLQVHQADYVQSVQSFAASGGGRIEADTIVSPRSFDVATRAAGAACDAVRRVVTGEDHTALCLLRPPGHHALPHHAMGFCLLNNVAVAAKYALEQLEIDRVLVIDWDVHHGNGTQNMFWTCERVGFYSIHRWPFYPGSGREHETGSGAGLGYTCNQPITFGTPRADYLSQFARSLETFAAHVQPNLVLVSAGFDSHRLDPIGSLGLEVEDFADLTSRVKEVAAAWSGGRLVSVLEGGYNPAMLAESVGVHLGELSKPE